jgi:phosphoglycolate phosphatase
MTATIVFDLDGTLIDSAQDIAAATNKMLAEQGVAPLSVAQVTSFVGDGLPSLVERVMRHCELDASLHPQLCDATLSHYNAAGSELTKVYPGVYDALNTLREQGCQMGICTNKPVQAAHHVLEALSLAPFFDAVIGGDSLPQRKPNPTPLLATFDALPRGVRVYVGDSEVDAETAQRAAIPFLLFTQGYRKTEVDQIPHTINYDDSRVLPEIVAQALSASGN